MKPSMKMYIGWRKKMAKVKVAKTVTPPSVKRYEPKSRKTRSEIVRAVLRIESP